MDRVVLLRQIRARTQPGSMFPFQQSVKRLAGPKRPLIAFKKPVPCMVRPSIVYRRPAPRLFRPSIAFKKPVPCVGMPSIAFEKPLVPCMAGSPEILRRTDVPPIECDRFARNVSVLLKRAPSDARRLAVRQKRAPIRPCVLSHHHRPCTDRNVTVKRNDGRLSGTLECFFFKKIEKKKRFLVVFVMKVLVSY